jgi:hypothetical protein
MAITAGRSLMTDATILSIIWVRSGVSALPVGGGMALGTIRSKHAFMEGWVGVTGRTGGRRALEDTVHVAASTGHIDMGSGQFEC